MKEIDFAGFDSVEAMKTMLKLSILAYVVVLAASGYPSCDESGGATENVVPTPEIGPRNYLPPIDRKPLIDGINKGDRPITPLPRTLGGNTIH